MPSVSVLIPAYNEADVVDGAIESVLTQSVEDLELLLIDGGSTDGTMMVMQEYADDNRVCIIEQDHQGYPDALNAGLDAAHSAAEWIGFCGADDRWLPEKLDRQLACADAETDVVHADAYHIDATGDRTGRRWDGPNAIQGQGQEIIERLYDRCDVCMQTALVRHNWLQDRRFDTDLRATYDHDLWLELATSGARFTYMNQPVIEKRYEERTHTYHYERLHYDRETIADRYAEFVSEPAVRAKQRRNELAYGINLALDWRADEARETIIDAMKMDWRDWKSPAAYILSFKPRFLTQLADFTPFENDGETEER